MLNPRLLIVPRERASQETVKPHPQFMLFATQNPPGLYGGRKVLSRAFRNRFVEMHVEGTEWWGSNQIC